MCISRKPVLTFVRTPKSASADLRSKREVMILRLRKAHSKALSVAKKMTESRTGMYAVVVSLLRHT